MTPTRRTFLAGLGAALAAPAVIRTPGLLMPVRIPVVHLWGDGMHCDAEGLQALVDGFPIRLAGKLFRRRHLPAVSIMVQSPVYLAPNQSPEFGSARVTIRAPALGAGIFQWPDGSMVLCAGADDLKNPPSRPYA